MDSLMNFLLDNWFQLVAAAACGVFAVLLVRSYCTSTKEKRHAQVKGWLLQAVLLAEREYGSGTGKLKLSKVYDMFCTTFPWLAKVLTFETFSGYVDEALTEMKTLLSQNEAIAAIVEEGADDA